MVPGTRWLQLMSPFFPARHLLLDGIEAVFPVWLAANLDEDVAAHEVLDLRGQLVFVIQQRRVVEVPSAS